MSEAGEAPPQDDVAEAIAIAKAYARRLFAAEKVTNVGLEEVRQDVDGTWQITVGFSRPWDDTAHPVSRLYNMGSLSPLQRTYKVVTVDMTRRQATAILNRDLS